MSKTEAQIHKATFKETKTPWYKKAITPWVLILIVSVFAGGTMLGWYLRSDFANEVRSEVKDQMVVVNQVSKANQ